MAQSLWINEEALADLFYHVQMLFAANFQSKP
jgi:hypothetical protein